LKNYLKPYKEKLQNYTKAVSKKESKEKTEKFSEEKEISTLKN